MLLLLVIQIIPAFSLSSCPQPLITLLSQSSQCAPHCSTLQSFDLATLSCTTQCSLNTCQSPCPLGHRLTNNQCKKCEVQGCLLCQEQNQCLACETPLYVEDGQCRAECSQQKILLAGYCKTVPGMTFEKIRGLQAKNYTIVQVGPGQYEVIFDIDPNEYPDMNFTVTIKQPKSVTSKNGNIPVQTQQTVSISNTVEFQASEVNVYIVDVMKLVIGFYVTVVFLTYWEGASVWMYSCAVMQMLALSYYVNVVFSPTMNNALLQLQWAFLNFLPNPLAPHIGNATLVTSLPDKIFESLGDNSYARSGGYLLTVVIVVGIISLIVGLLSWQKISPDILQKPCSSIFRKYFKFRVLNETLLLFYIPIVLYGCLQFHAFHITNFALGFGVALDICLLLLAGVWPAVLAYKLWAFTNSQFTLQYILQDCEQRVLSNIESEDFNVGHVYSYQERVLDLRNPRSPKINRTSIYPVQSSDSYCLTARMHYVVLCLKLLISGVIAAAALQNPIIQVSGILLVNVVYLLYLVLVWPSRVILCRIKLHNWYCLFSELFLTAYWTSILVYVIRDTWSADRKTSYCTMLTIMMMLQAIIHVIYLIARACYEIYARIWIPMARTEWFSEEFPQTLAYIKEDLPVKNEITKDSIKDIEKLLERKHKAAKNILRPKINLDLLDQDYLPQHLRKQPSVSHQILSRRSQYSTSKASMSKPQRKNALKNIFKQEAAKQGMDDKYEPVLNEEDEFFERFHRRRPKRTTKEEEDNETDFTYEYWEESYEVEDFEARKDEILAGATGDFVI